MDEKIFRRVGNSSQYVFVKMTKEDLFWDQVRMDINEALLLWFKDNAKKEHGSTYRMDVEFIFGENDKKKLANSVFEVNKKESVIEFQERFGLDACGKISGFARKDINMDDLQIFTVTFNRLARGV